MVEDVPVGVACVRINLSVLEGSGMKSLLTTAQIAEWLGIDERTIYRLCRLNQIPYIRLGRRSIRFDGEAIQNWLKRRQQGYWSA